MIAASIFLASVVAVWLGWRYEESRRLDREAAVLLARIEWDGRIEVARIGMPPVQDMSVKVAQIQADAARDVARIQFPDSPPVKPALREVQLPDDLEAHVMQWGDEFAREDERAYFRKLYLEMHTGDDAETWRRVRSFAHIAELGEAV